MNKQPVLVGSFSKKDAGSGIKFKALICFLYITAPKHNTNKAPGMIMHAIGIALNELMEL
jgi:hypothetical protein